MSSVKPTYVRQQDMQAVFGIHPVQVWRLLKNEKSNFPNPIVLSPRRKVFEYEAVKAWLAKRVETEAIRQAGRDIRRRIRETRRLAA